ncbi:hypothetical protein AHAS_Ahas07G0123500 [Arachis hypogaea]
MRHRERGSVEGRRRSQSASRRGNHGRRGSIHAVAAASNAYYHLQIHRRWSRKQGTRAKETVRSCRRRRGDGLVVVLPARLLCCRSSSPPLLAPETAFQASQTLGNFSQDYNCISCSANFSCQLTENIVAAFFQEWTQQVQDILNTKKFGDIAFEDKDFKNAIEYYSKVRRYTFSLNSGAVEELELDSFGLSIMPSSLVSTYSLLVEDVLKVVSDACCGSQSCSVAYTKAFKGTFISIMEV